jgi:signal transduction histidine kinase
MTKDTGTVARAIRSQDHKVTLANRIHATLLNQIAALVAQSQVCESALGSGDGKLFTEIARLRDMLRTLEEATRELVEATIEPGALDLADALRAEVEEFQRRHPGIRVEGSWEGVASIRIRWLTRLIIDVVHEALANAARHGRPSELQVIASRVSGGLLVRIRDNGRGFDARVSGRTTSGALGHYGIHIMQERAKSAQGRLEISSAPGKGTQVTLFVPVS